MVKSRVRTIERRLSMSQAKDIKCRFVFAGSKEAKEAEATGEKVFRFVWTNSQGETIDELDVRVVRPDIQDSDVVQVVKDDQLTGLTDEQLEGEIAALEKQTKTN